MNWATPRVGTTGVDWAGPLLEYWEKIKPKGDNSSPLFPWWDKEWVISASKKGTGGTTQAALARLEEKLGFSLKLKIHSPRAWFSTCAHQLLYPREDREKLGRWAPGSLMPDLYDRAICATELRLRDEILNRIRSGGWEPSNAFETPGKKKPIETKAETKSNSSVSDTSSLSSDEDITDLWGEKNKVIDFDGSKGYV